VVVKVSRVFPCWETVEVRVSKPDVSRSRMVIRELSGPDITGAVAGVEGIGAIGPIAVVEAGIRLRIRSIPIAKDSANFS